MNGALLQGALADDARRTLDSLSRRYLSLPLPRSGGPTLSRGTAGLALLHSALHDVLPDRGHARRAEKCLSAAIEAVASDALGFGLYSGFSGIAWAAELIQGQGEDDPNEAVDEALISLLDGDGAWVDNFDLISGLVGIGVYALGRADRPGGARVLEHVVRRLLVTAERRSEGVVWTTDPGWLSERYRGERTMRHVDLGLAHGVPGVVALMAAAVGAGVGGREARAALDGSVDWLLGQELDPSAPSRFAYLSESTLPMRPARLAWCYGDLSVAWALLLAARVTRRREWEATAIRVALAAAHRSEDTGVKDAGLCHGTAGIGHVFHRMARATGDERLADAARAWFRATLDLRRTGPWLGGFWAASEEPPHRRSDPSVLTGTAGIALALASALSPAPLSWDRFLLIQLPGAA